LFNIRNSKWNIKNKLFTFSLFAVFGTVFLLSFSFNQEAESHVDGGFSINSGLTTTAPTIDGNIGASEWSSANSVTIWGGTGAPNSILYVMNDGTNLYMALDATDSTLTPGCANDIWDTRFDDNENGMADDGDDQHKIFATGCTTRNDAHFDSGLGFWAVEDSIDDVVFDVNLQGARLHWEVTKPLCTGNTYDPI